MEGQTYLNISWLSVDVFRGFKPFSFFFPLMVCHWCRDRVMKNARPGSYRSVELPVHDGGVQLFSLCCTEYQLHTARLTLVLKC